MNTRHAVAAVVRREGGLVLAVQRPDGPGEELPGVWGLPATTLLEGEAADDGVRRLGPEKLGVDLTPLRSIASGRQQREDYVLHMTVHEALANGEPTLPSVSTSRGTQYVALDWLPEERFAEAAEKGSLCCALLLAAADAT